VKKKGTSVPPDKLRLYERLVAAAGIDAKANFGASYTAVNGNMFSMISKHGVVGIRLPDADRQAFIEKYNAEIFRADPAWPPNPEYVAVPDTLLPKTKTLKPYLERSYQYALTLRKKK
jgi:hypothetical protein